MVILIRVFCKNFLGPGSHWARQYANTEQKCCPSWIKAFSLWEKASDDYSLIPGCGEERHCVSG